MAPKTKIRIFTTGGTIDGIEKNTPKNHKSIIPAALKQSRATVPYSFETLLQKDSRFITEEDKQLILSKCRACRETRIVITCGTMRMADIAAFLGKRIKGKIVVLTGAMLPFKNPRSDALFNLGSALAAVQLLSPGVYIAMNARIFRAGKVKKNMKKGIFETAR